jgi:hypothetical protein
LNTERNDDLGQIYPLLGISDALIPHLFGEGKIISTKPVDTVSAYSRRHGYSFP